MILITGGAGVMGCRLTEKLLNNGHRVRILALPDDPALENLKDFKVDIYCGDISDINSIQEICENVKTVYHLAAILLSPHHPDRFWKINYEGTKNIIELAEKSIVQHFIYVSSASVTYPRTNEYAKSKKAAEALIINSNIPHYTIVRPTLAYEDGGAAEIMHFINYLKKFPVIPFIGKGDAFKSPVFVEDIINGLTNINENEKTFNKIYNFSGGNELTMKEMAQQLLAHMGKKKLIIPVPVTICKALSFISCRVSKLMGKQPLLTRQTITGVTQDANLDHSNARKDIYYNPRSFQEGINELVSIKDCLV